MRVAIISDVHGNFTALETILPDIKEADRIVCLGDVAASGPQPHETITFLRKAKWPCVMGNADETLAKSEREGYNHMPEGDREKMIALDDWTASQVDASDRKFLSGFKPTIEVRDRDNTLFCYHGSPRSNTEQILPTTSEEELARIIYAAKRAEVYAGGHTHAQMVRKLGPSLVINPGSVGLPFFKDAEGRTRNPAWAEYAILTSSKDGARVELRRERYSLGDLRSAVRRSGMPDSQWWLADWV